jgi:hypothetical protein
VYSDGEMLSVGPELGLLDDEGSLLGSFDGSKLGLLDDEGSLLGSVEGILLFPFASEGATLSDGDPLGLELTLGASE